MDTWHGGVCTTKNPVGRKESPALQPPSRLAHYIATTLYCDTHQPVGNILVSESLLQFEGVKEGPKSRIGTLCQPSAMLSDLGKPARAELC